MTDDEQSNIKMKYMVVERREGETFDAFVQREQRTWKLYYDELMEALKDDPTNVGVDIAARLRAKGLID